MNHQPRVCLVVHDTGPAYLRGNRTFHGEGLQAGEINIAGRLPETLASIDAVGNDVTFRDAAAAPTFRMARMVISGR
jgi:hypothetical protein